MKIKRMKWIISLPLLDKEVVDGKVKQDFFSRVKELQGVIDKLFRFE